MGDYYNNYENDDKGINEDYLREMERNSQLFEEKMKKLNRFRYQNQPATPQYSQKEPQRNYQESDNSNARYIEQLKNEINYKDIMITELKEKLDQKNTNSYQDNRENDEYVKQIDIMQNDLDTRYRENGKLKEEIENLKLKIENLKLENMNIKSTKEKQINQSENLSIELAEAKQEISILRKKLGEMDIQNKKLNKDYDGLSKNYSLLRKENSNLKSEIEDLKAMNYNLNQDINETRKKQREKDSISASASYPKPNSSITQGSRISSAGMSQNMWNRMGQNSEGFDTNKEINSTYYRRNIQNNGVNINKESNSTYDGFNYFPSEHKIKENQSEVSSLEAQLSLLLKEKKVLENELFKFPERPRTLNEIKAKKEKNERINYLDEEINKIKTRLRQLN